MAENNPGQFYDRAIEKMANTLGARGGAVNTASPKQWVTYLNAIVRAQAKPEDLPPEHLQELHALAESMDAAGSGSLKGMLDIMTQRFKSLELKSLGQKEISSSFELVDSGARGLATKAERIAANKLQLTDLRLKESAQRLRR